MPNRDLVNIICNVVVARRAARHRPSLYHLMPAQPEFAEFEHRQLDQLTMMQLAAADDYGGLAAYAEYMALRRMPQRRSSPSNASTRAPSSGAGTPRGELEP